jgi:hypothetical protein
VRGYPADEQGPIVPVPVQESARNFPQQVIELITDLALAEDLYAVATLDDVLQQEVDVAGNGDSASATVEPSAH